MDALEAEGRKQAVAEMHRAARQGMARRLLEKFGPRPEAPPPPPAEPDHSALAERVRALLPEKPPAD